MKKSIFSGIKANIGTGREGTESIVDKSMVSIVHKSMKRALSCIGLPLLYIGVMVMVVASFLPIDNRNAINLSALTLIYAGAIGYVIKEKRK